MYGPLAQPERISGQSYVFNSDIWSFGLCIAECALGVFPYPSVSVYFEMVQAIVNEPPPQLDSAAFSAEFCSFIAACLNKDATKRLGAAQLLSHPWINNPEHEKFDFAQWLAANDVSV